MSLLRSWAHSLTLLLPHRLFGLLFGTIRSMGTIYKELWLYILAYTGLVAIVKFNVPSTGETIVVSPTSPIFIGMTLIIVLGFVLQLLAFAAALPADEPKNFSFYTRRLVSRWPLFLLFLLQAFITLPVAFVVAVVASFIERAINFTPTSIWTYQYETLDGNLESPRAKFDINLFGYEFQRVGFEALALATVANQIVNLYIGLTMAAYLDGTGGFGNFMRALGRAIKLILCNLPFVSLWLAVQVGVILLNIGWLHKTSIQAALLTEGRVDIAALASLLIFVPLSVALTVEIYKALAPRHISA